RRVASTATQASPLQEDKVHYRDRALRVAAALRAEAERADLGRDAAACPPSLPPLRMGERCSGFPYPPPPGFSPPLWTLLTVAQARRSASASGMPRCSYPCSMCSA